MRLSTHLNSASGLAAAHLLEALQRALHVLITPEDVGEGALHRVQVGQGGLLLSRHRLQSLLGTQLVALFILCQERRRRRGCEMTDNVFPQYH